MASRDGGPVAGWEDSAAWELHERAELLRTAALSLGEKLEALEAMARLARHLQSQVRSSQASRERSPREG